MRLWQKRILLFIACTIAFTGVNMLWAYLASGRVTITSELLFEWPLIWAFIIAAFVPWHDTVILIISPELQEKAIAILQEKRFRYSEKFGGTKVYVRHMGPIAWWKATIRKEHEYLELGVPDYFVKYFQNLAH